MLTTLFAAADPATFSGLQNASMIMITCNGIAYAIARANIQKT